MHLGIRIASWRKHKGLTQADIAQACDVTVSAVSLWEAGKASPTQEHLVTIVGRLGLSMSRFYARAPRSRAAA